MKVTLVNTGGKEVWIMSKKKPRINSIGLIVEDNSDFTSFKILISRILKKDNLTFRKAVGSGCGKMRRKAESFIKLLNNKGCDLIIMVHDLDKNNYQDLHDQLTEVMRDGPANHNIVCIPVEELEGWFLSDPEGIKEVFQLHKKPNISGNPETINDPKEKLARYILECSNKSKIYINNKHNDKLAMQVSIAEMKSKCDSFNSFIGELDKYHF